MIGRRWKVECVELAQELPDEYAALGYDEIVERFVRPDKCETREVAGLSGQIYTMHVEAFWEDTGARSVHLSVTGNRGEGLGLTGRGGWTLLEPPVADQP